jgi:hypothetical protein
LASNRAVFPEYLPPLIAEKLIRTAKWHFDDHALSQKRWRSISLNCAIRGKTADDGGRAA